MLEMAGDDLRKSIGPGGADALTGNLKEQLQLLKELEKVRAERDDLKRSKEQLQRDILNQTFGK